MADDNQQLVKREPNTLEKLVSSSKYSLEHNKAEIAKIAVGIAGFAGVAETLTDHGVLAGLGALGAFAGVKVLRSMGKTTVDLIEYAYKGAIGAGVTAAGVGTALVTDSPALGVSTGVAAGLGSVFSWYKNKVNGTGPFLNLKEEKPGYTPYTWLGKQEGMVRTGENVFSPRLLTLGKVKKQVTVKDKDRKEKQVTREYIRPTEGARLVNVIRDQEGNLKDFYPVGRVQHVIKGLDVYGSDQLRAEVEVIINYHVKNEEDAWSFYKSLDGRIDTVDDTVKRMVTEKFYQHPGKEFGTLIGADDEITKAANNYLSEESRRLGMAIGVEITGVVVTDPEYDKDSQKIMQRESDAKSRVHEVNRYRELARELLNESDPRVAHLTTELISRKEGTTQVNLGGIEGILGLISGMQVPYQGSNPAGYQPNTTRQRALPSGIQPPPPKKKP